ncbi:proteasome-type protease [Xanthomonas sp. SS]|uniref:20S proteasome subunit A/B n=1 Tax=Xanthomonas sp. SS TaxID=2724122 RepID=UPI00163A77DC|nr:20S proteasome subunit A/B [Xanthomonas sp. SS]QNH18170.1 proteasome-type protease [Xanthomonas sp. SS]
MTYCVGIEVDEGLVFAADTRTNASLDDVRVHRKLHVFEYPGQAVFVLMSAGNLATTQLAISKLQRDADDPDAPRSLRSFKHLFEVAEYVGEVLVSSQIKLSEQSQHSGVSVQSTLILGGQIAGERPGLYMIYPLGNAIATSPETPYLQIGESKYGKPILDRIIRSEMQLEDAARTALVSLDSTIRSNLSVGMPIDLAVIRRNDLRVTERLRLEADTPLYSEIHDTWSRKLENAVRTLPRFPWEPALTTESDADTRGTLPPLPPRRVPARRDPEDQSSQQ